MTLDKITNRDLEGKGVIGQPEVPGLSAAEMQAKVEQIVREVAIEKINEIIDYVINNTPTNEDLARLVVEAGAVTSVFGRVGDVFAKAGDYTPEMVGAAAATHAERHRVGGADPIGCADVGAAAENHSHGAITSDGKLGIANGLMVVTGVGGKLETKPKTAVGFELTPEEVNITGAFTAQDNKIYIGENLSDFIFTCDTAKRASCHGWITFGTRGTVTLSGFDFIDDADGIAEAQNQSRWEFDLARGCLIIKKRSA